MHNAQFRIAQSAIIFILRFAQTDTFGFLFQKMFHVKHEEKQAYFCLPATDCLYLLLYNSLFLSSRNLWKSELRKQTSEASFEKNFLFPGENVRKKKNISNGSFLTTGFCFPISDYMPYAESKASAERKR